VEIVALPLKAMEKWNAMVVNTAEKRFPGPLILLAIYAPTQENSHINAIFVNGLFLYRQIYKDTFVIYTIKKNHTDVLFVIVALASKPILIVIYGNMKMMDQPYWMAWAQGLNHI
jgi:hypothetical protein